MTTYFATRLRDAGCTVHVATAATHSGDLPHPGELGAGITWERLPPVSDPTYLTGLRSRVAARPSAVFFPMTEAILYALWSEPTELDARTFPHVAPWQRELLRDKSAVSRFAAEHGVRVPREYPLDTARDVHAGVAALGLPVVVKGAVGAGGGAVRVARTVADALAAYAAISPTGRCFLQEYIEGATYFVGGLFQDGDPIRLYGAEVLEQRPLETGASIRVRSLGGDALLEPALTVSRALRWTGATAINLMRAADGTYCFLEFNPRPWGSMDVAERVGVDLFTPLVRMLAGGRPEPALGYREGVESAVYMKFALDRLERGGLEGVLTFLRDRRGWMDLPWRSPRLLAFALRRLGWDWRYRTSLRGTSRTRAKARCDNA